MKILKIILTLICTITLFSCDEKSGGNTWNPYPEYEHDDNAITVHHSEDYNYPIDSLQIYIPTNNKHTLYIKGGDRNYTITQSETDLLKLTLEQGNVLVIEPLKIGKVEIPIMDGANHSYLLKIEMLYRTMELIVARTNIVIKGEKLTELEKDTIKEKALKRIPVKVNGGYKFTWVEFTEKGSRGVVSIYPNHFGENDDSTQEYNFEEIFDEPINNYQIRSRYIINIDGSNRVFRLGQGVLPTKSYDYLMIEDLTEYFKTKYPSVEKVFAQQQAFIPHTNYLQPIE